MPKNALIIVAGTNNQNICFWPSYNRCIAGIDHDLIIVHRNMNFVPEVHNKYGKVILENKVKPDGSEIEHKAFGAYRHFWNKYKNSYDFFAFISDDVIIKSDYWLLEAFSILESCEKLGFVGTQIFNGSNGQYPHPSHCRAPAWFSNSKRLENINWYFDSDHEGEMSLSEHFLAAGYFGCQVGNKMDIAYDAIENGGMFKGDHIVPIMEKNLGRNPEVKMEIEEKKNLNKMLRDMLENGQDHLVATSPFQHIGSRKIISQLQPFNGLVIDKGLNISEPYITHERFGINILKLNGSVYDKGCTL